MNTMSSDFLIKKCKSKEMGHIDIQEKSIPNKGRASQSLWYSRSSKEHLGLCGWNRLGFVKGRMEEHSIIKRRGQGGTGLLPNFQTFYSLIGIFEQRSAQL